jgi:ribosomal protein S18 acetylase RimI-like enzyme
MDEVAAATDLLNAHSQALHGVDDCTPAELEEAWRAPEVEFPTDVFVAERNGRIVGYADVIPFGNTSWVDVRATDPEAYDPLLDAATARGAEHDKQHIRAFAGDQDDAASAAIERAGYQPIRYGFRMLMEFDGELPEPQWPGGYTVRPYREGDAETFYRLHQGSFADTWEFTTEPFEPWEHWFMGAQFQPEHWFVVEAGSEPAAIAICRIAEAEENTGWVRILGVLPAHRRRGLALALLQHVFRHFAALGMKRVVLGVDGENPTGAVALYERAGMSVLRRNVTYERVSG